MYDVTRGLWADIVFLFRLRLSAKIGNVKVEEATFNLLSASPATGQSAVRKISPWISLVWPPEGGPRHEACRSSILPLFIYPGTFIKSTCNYGLHVLRGRVLSLRLPVISILTPPLRPNVAVTSGLYDTAMRCRVGSCVVTERLMGRFFSSDSLWLSSQNSEFDELFLYLF